MSSEISSTADLNRSAADFARRLICLSEFPQAARELLTCRNLSPNNFRLYARKIVTLVEIARNSLLRAGLKLYIFATCPRHLFEHKKYYFEFLQMLQSKRPLTIESGLRERVIRLLLPLSSQFRIGSQGNYPRRALDSHCDKPSAEPTASSSSSSSENSSSPSPPIYTSHQSPSNTPAITMLPPDELMKRRELRIQSIRKSRSLKRVPPKKRHSHHRSPRILRDTGKGTASTFIPPQPAKGRFGIFCTGKQSSVGRQRTDTGATGAY